MTKTLRPLLSLLLSVAFVALPVAARAQATKTRVEKAGVENDGDFLAGGQATTPAPVVNVKSAPYNAAGDGTTSDTAHLQAALNACAAAGGCRLVVPHGTYKTTALTYSGDNLTIEGDGLSGSRIAMSSATGDTLTVVGNPARHVVIRNLEFYPSVARTSGSEIRIDYSLRVTLEDLQIHDCHQALSLGGFANAGSVMRLNRVMAYTYTVGAWFKRLNDLWVSNCTFDTNNSSTANVRGWIIDSGVDGCAFSNTDITNSAVGGANSRALLVQHTGGGGLNPPRHCYFTNIYLDSHEWGMVATAGADFVFTSCWFLGSISGGAYVQSPAITYAFVGSTFARSGGNGLDLFSGGDHLVEGCIFWGNGVGATTSGLHIEAAVSGAVVKGSRFSNNSAGWNFPASSQQYGIQVDAGADNLLITDNDVRGNTAAGIKFGAGPVGPTKILRHNLGFVTENSGTGSVAAGSTSVNVPHGLSLQPGAQHIDIKPTNISTNSVRWAVTATSPTTFTLTLSGDPGASGFRFGWSAAIQ
jgi:hypothetical protein